MYRFMVLLVILVENGFLSKSELSNSESKQQSESLAPPRIRIRAILIRCPQHIIPDNSLKGRDTNHEDKAISVLRTDDILAFAGFDKDELLMHSEVKNCKRKMIITIVINNYGRTITEEEFVVVDHVYDPELRKRSRLLNPFVFKVKQDPVLQLYGMRYVQSVNAMAREEVINKGMSNFTGCDTTTTRATCGLTFQDNNPVPYSEGFCCSCDSSVNLQRQPEPGVAHRKMNPFKPKQPHYSEEEDDDHGKLRRDLDKKSDSSQKLDKSNIKFLRSKSMLNNYDFEKNGFEAAQIFKSVGNDHTSKVSDSNEDNSWSRNNRFSDLDGKVNKLLWNNDHFDSSPFGVQEGGYKEEIRQNSRRSVEDQAEYCPDNSRTRTEKPFLVKPNDWRKSLKALKLKAKGFKPDSSIPQHAYQPKHEYKVFSGEPVMEVAKGFQTSDFRPRWDTKYKIRYKKPSPWEILPRLCSHSDDKQRNTTKKIIRLLAKLDGKQGNINFLVDPEDKIVHQMTKKLANKLAEDNINKENSYDNHTMSNSNYNYLMLDDSTDPYDEERYDELENALAKFIFEDVLGYQEFLGGEKSLNEFDTVDDIDKEMIIKRWKRQLNDWLRDNYNVNCSNRCISSFLKHYPILDDHLPIQNTNSFISNEFDPYLLNDKVELFTRDEHHFPSDSDVNSSSEFDYMKNLDSGERKGKNVTHSFNLDLLQRNRNALGLLHDSSIGSDQHQQPVKYSEKKNIENSPNNLVEKSGIGNRDVNKDYMFLKRFSYDNMTLTNPELLQKEMNGYGYDSMSTIVYDTVHKNGNLIFHNSYPALHHHTGGAPVFIDKIKLDTPASKKFDDHSIGLLNDTFSSSNPLLPNEPYSMNIIQSEKSDPQKVLNKNVDFGLSDKSFQDQKKLSVSHSEPNEYNYKMIDIPQDNHLNIEKMNKFVKERTQPLITDTTRNLWLSSEEDKIHNQNQHIMKDFENSISNDPDSSIMNGHKSKVYHIYKQEMETNNEPDYRTLKFKDKDSDEKPHHSDEVAAGLKNPPILNPFEVKTTNQHSGLQNPSHRMYQEAVDTRTNPIIFSGNVSNICGQKGTLVFIPDETEQAGSPSTAENKSGEKSKAVKNLSVDDSINERSSIGEDSLVEDGTYVKNKNKNRVKRQVSPMGSQVRGGQNCIDRYVPSHANPVTYHESAHCLRFSDLWYSVYTLKRPNLDHALHLQLYEKHNYADKSTHWEELTRGIVTDLGTVNRHIEDGSSTLSFTYIPLNDLMQGDFCLDEHRATLLVPEPLPPDLVSKYPQVNGSPNEYLLVQSEDISLDGTECDKVGTSFEGFARQPDRCAQARGTCLKNQPLDMWTHDAMARDEGKRGKFFLENYASVADQALQVNQSSKEQSLALEYYNMFSTVIEIEVRSDLNAIVRTGESGQLSDIYVDSTCDSSTKITVMVTNRGLASSAYYPKLSRCPPELPDVWTRDHGPLTMIPPQHRHTFQITMFGELPLDRAYCSVELMNDKDEMVATRRIRIQKHDRCMCVWHCLCACSASTVGLSCQAMSVQHFHAAGFQGSLPVTNFHPETKPEKLLKILIPTIIVIVALLLVGLMKAVFGLCFATIGACGLWAICKSSSKKLEAYKEDELRDYYTEHDSSGYAIHPINRTRNIKLFNKFIEFFVNTFFLFLLIWEVLVIILCRCCKSDEYAKLKSDDETSTSSFDSEQEPDDLEDESDVEVSMMEEKREVPVYNVQKCSNECLIMAKKPQEDK